jgi:hypothetical protein
MTTHEKALRLVHIILTDALNPRSGMSLQDSMRSAIAAIEGAIGEENAA